jgi:serine protease AprX
MISRTWLLARHVVVRLALALSLSLATLLPTAPPTSAQSVSLSQVQLLKISPQLLAQITANPLRRVPVIVEMNPASAPFPRAINLTLAQQALALLQANGVGVGALPIINGAAGYANAADVVALSALPQVARIEQDALVGPPGLSSTPPARRTAPLSSLSTQEINAPRVWSTGVTGRGVTVAVLDSGIAPDQDLTAGGNRLLASVNFAGPYDPTRWDPGGHGTHIAGTIAGNGARSNGQFIGVAPQANLVSVRVLDANGVGRMSSVLRGIEWVLAHQTQYNIRVLNLSLGAPAQWSYKTDPLAAAAEIAWRHGLVVVAASGNVGPDSGNVVSPGIDPLILTVGAVDDQVTPTLADDTVAWFSAWGTPTDGRAKPDLVAPGRQVVSIHVPGSTLDQLYPDHQVVASNNATYLRLTGTSMATAVASGAAALLLQRSPSLTPDQVKQILTGSTQRFGSVSPPPSAGAGLLNAQAAVASQPASTSTSVTPMRPRPADALARTLYPAIYGQRLFWLNGGVLGQLWNAETWALTSWTASTWDNVAWDNIAWDQSNWDNIAWDQSDWDNIAWDQSDWDNIAWDTYGAD